MLCKKVFANTYLIYIDFLVHLFLNKQYLFLAGTLRSAEADFKYYILLQIERIHVDADIKYYVLLQMEST